MSVGPSRGRCRIATPCAATGRRRRRARRPPAQSARRRRRSRRRMPRPTPGGSVDLQPVHVDPQVVHGVRHLRRPREAHWRAHGEVTAGRRAPPDDHRCNDAQGEPVGRRPPRRARPARCADHQAVHRPAQVGQPGQGDGGGDGELDDREPGIEARRTREWAGRPAAGPRSASSSRQTNRAATAAAAIWRTAFSRGTSSPSRIRPTVTPSEPTNQMAVISQCMPGRRGSDQFGEVDLHGCIGFDQGDADHQQHGGDADPHGVRGPTPCRAPAVRSENQGADALAPGGVAELGGGRQEVGAGAELRWAQSVPMRFMSAGPPACLRPGPGPGESSTTSWPVRALRPGTEVIRP